MDTNGREDGKTNRRLTRMDQIRVINVVEAQTETCVHFPEIFGAAVRPLFFASIRVHSRLIFLSSSVSSADVAKDFEGQNNFYRVFCWSLESKALGFAGDFDKIAESFREEKVISNQ